MKKNGLTEKHLYLPKSERNGILLFFIISIIGIIIFRKITSPANQINIITTPSISEPISSTRSKKSHTKKSFERGSLKSFQTIAERKKFLFNPNTLSKDSLYLLGFSKPVIENIFKYRTKGGKINSLQQFKKIYGIDTSLVSSLKDYTIFPEKTNENKKYEDDMPDKHVGIKGTNTYSKEDVFVKIELNEADSMQLISLKGIGPYFAKKILKMRKTMGGYSSPEQIRECNVLPDSVYFKIKDQIWVDTSKMAKIDLNEVTFKTLIQHPYFEENLVRVIMNFKENHGPFTSLSQLKKIKLLTRDKYEKIIKHLKI